MRFSSSLVSWTTLLLLLAMLQPDATTVRAWTPMTTSARLIRPSSFSSFRQTTRLTSSPNDDDDDNSNDDESKRKKLASFAKDLSSKMTTQMSSLKEKMTLSALLEWFQSVAAWFQAQKYVLLSFGAGMVLTLSAILVPLNYYSQLASESSLNQPVTLFETILTDLDQAYVDQVDTQRLFETGVAAMLQSLDPYTEFEGKEEAVEMAESIDGKYGGVGLVIAGVPKKQQKVEEQPVVNTNGAAATETQATPVTLNEDGEDDYDDEDAKEVARLQRKARQDGIRVVSAFEGYAFDYGMRVGDKLVAVDDVKVSPDTSVEDIRNVLRGEPGTDVSISFTRDGVDGVQTVTMPRTVVRLRDVKLATLLGKASDGIGYIQLSGFASDAGREVRNAITYLQQATEDATNGERSLQGLVLDLRGNPGGLLTSAVDVASLLVPKGSDIVSAKGRGFPGILYRSRVDPILDSKTRLAVLVNSQTASAAEIVSGAVQDLDVGVIVGSDRTFGKGLVQNVQELPYDTALKFTVAKYYTPSGRCIQGINYKEGGGSKSETDGKYISEKVADKDRSVFYTTNGRVVRDGGGVEADYKVPTPKASALEITLLRSGILNEFAAEWSKTHELTNNFAVDNDTYKAFQAFVQRKQKSGDLKLEALYNKPLQDLKKALKQSGYRGSEKTVEQLQARIIRDIESDFEKYQKDIKEDIGQSILARYLPESMLIDRSVKNDAQVDAALKIIKTKDSTFDSLLAREKSASAFKTANAQLQNELAVATQEDPGQGIRARVEF